MIIPVAGQKRLVLVGATGLVGGYARSRPGATFSFLSGNGVDPTRRSRIAFARYNGEGENPILATGFSPRLHISTRLYLPRGAAQRTEFQLPADARDLPGVSGAVPQSSDSPDDLARAMVDVRRSGNTEDERSCSREPGHPSYGRIARYRAVT
jgi:hypothetical protein